LANSNKTHPGYLKLQKVIEYNFLEAKETYVLHFIATYGLFLAKTATIVLAIIIIFLIIAASAAKSKATKLKLKKINEQYDDYKKTLNHEILSKSERKQFVKAEKARQKSEKKQQGRKRVFVLDFNGDIRAHATSSLREEITAILTVANPEDEVVVRLESPGGIVPNYGLAASQLKRLRDKNIPLTIIVDKIAASGGYLMACVGNKILAAPYAVIGSIGVVAQLPNFNRLLKKNDIDFEQITAGQYKRTLSLFGEITEDGREKAQEDVNIIHEMFKAFILANRPGVDIEKVATGEHWLAVKTLELNLGLVDTPLCTSDDYLLKASTEKDIYELHYEKKKTLADKLSLSLKHAYQAFFGKHHNYDVFY
jgi:serine protease SohB